MKVFVVNIILLFILLSSCKQDETFKEPLVPPAAILKNIISYLNYQEEYIKLSGDFVALDSASKIINKETFLKFLSSGEYLPLRLVSKDSSIYYKLYKLSSLANEDIRQTIKNRAALEYKYFRMEGMELPQFRFIDVEGNEYNNVTTRGKIIVLNCWFIKCQACVEEMPTLNDLVNRYKNRKDIIFLGLAFDSQEHLKAFLKKKTFDYQVVPAQENYLNEKLRIEVYPTHLIINKKGFIVKVLNDNNEMAAALHKESLK